MEPAVTDIAIIGMSCRFPGSPDPDSYWDQICRGRELVTSFSVEELEAAGVPRDVLADPNYVRATSLIEGARDFDPEFFGITPREAEVIDPQHRVFLELCWLALESGGYDPQRYEGDIGVFAGAARQTYLPHNIAPLLGYSDLLNGSVRGLQVDLGNYGDFLTTRASFKLGLRGPSLNVQTACSTSLVATHLACQSLILGDSDMALAGGVAIQSPEINGYFYEEGSISSPDGHCRPFDVNANGTVFGNGAGVVLLKRLGDALADRDHIVAVIKGTAVNNDGREKMSFTAPSVEGQAEVIARAQLIAGVDSQTIGLIEAHGTGTSLGDPIEIAGLVQAFDLGTVPKPFCAISAVKGQIGHLGAAAGVAGLIKAALAVERGAIPPCVNFTSLNPSIGLAESPFYVSRECTPWSGVRRAGVSSFGFGGTNAHVVLEQPPIQNVRASTDGTPRTLVLSARAPEALSRVRQRMSAFLGDGCQVSLDDVAYTLANGRTQLPYRTAVTATSPDGAARQLSEAVDPSPAVASDLPVTFAFPGQGSQFPGMGATLFEHDAVFRSTVERCLEATDPELREVLRDCVIRVADDESRVAGVLRQTQFAQPALFMMECALAHALMASGVTPIALIGHSVGEYAAACVAGVFGIEEGMRLVQARGRLMQTTGPGGMIAVALPMDELPSYALEILDLAAVNTSEQCVLSGDVAAIDDVEARLAEAGIEYSRLAVSHAFHSALMDPVLAEFEACVGSVDLQPARIAIASNVSGGWIDPDAVTVPSYWVEHLRRTVRFEDGLRAVLSRGPTVVAEVGPGRSIAAMVGSLSPQHRALTVTPVTPHAPSAATALEIAGGLWTRGARIDWHLAGWPSGARRTPLPGYPFERTTLWIEPQQAAASLSSETNTPVGTLLHVPRWRQTEIPKGVSLRHLLLVGASDPNLATRLRARGHSVLELPLAVRGPDSSTSGQDEASGIAALLARETRAAQLVDTVVFAWPLQAERRIVTAAEVAAFLSGGFEPLLSIVRSLARRQSPEGVDVLVTTLGRHSVLDGDRPRPELALLDGPSLVLPQEYPNVRLARVDVDASCVDSEVFAKVVSDELSGFDSGAVVAYREGRRFALDFAPVATTAAEHPWDASGSYLLTGGVGGIGLAIALDAAVRCPGVRLTLTHRTPLPPRSDWQRVIRARAGDDETRRRLETLLRIEDLGASVACVLGDVTDAEAMQRVRLSYGPFTGIVHCAGVPAGQLIETLDRHEVERVMLPKVQGALILSDVLCDPQTQWTAYCSSMSAVVGGVGQTAYASANSFLDALADARSRDGFRTVSVNFDAWSDVGMAVNSARNLSRHERSIAHPLFLSRVDEPGTVQLRCEIRSPIAWLVSEHRLGDRALLPGTMILELLRAAGELVLGTAELELREVDLIRPLFVDEDVTLLVRLTHSDADLQAEISSISPGGRATVHAVGRVAPGVSPPSSDRLLLGAHDSSFTGPKSGLLTLGPRWDNIVRRQRQAEDLILECRLGKDFESDLEHFALHPALLDTAAGALAAELGTGPYLPMSYECVRVYGRMPSSVRCRIRVRAASEDTLTLDVHVQDEEGNPIVELLGYSLRRFVAGGNLGETRPHAGPENERLVCTHSEIDGLRFVAVEHCPPGQGEVQIEVLATGLNFKEVLIATGLLDPDTVEYAFGRECAGIVAAIGEGVSELSVGDAVMAIGQGCFSRFVNVPASLVQHVPPGMTFTEAATIPVAFTTAYDCLVNFARLRPGERVLVHAATGGVGLAAIQVAAHLGAEVCGTAGSERKREYLLRLGMTTVMDSRSLSFESGAVAAGGVDVVLNSLGGDRIAAGLRTLRPAGRFIEIGKRDLIAGTTLDLRLFEQGISYVTYNPDIYGAQFTRCWRDVTLLLREGVLRPLPVTPFQPSAVAAAFQYMARAQHIGKVVVNRPGADEVIDPPTVEAGSHPVNALLPAAPIDSATGVRAFYGAIRSGSSQVLVSPGGISRRAAESVIAERVMDAPPASVRSHPRPNLAYPYEPAVTELERTIAEIWSSLLGLEPVGRQDRFLDLGGDSLCATQVVARIRATLGTRIAPADVLADHPLSQLADLLDQRLKLPDRGKDRGIEVGQL